MTAQAPDVPLVSVIIPTHQRREALRRILNSLARQSTAAERYEVVVGVDACTDGTHEMLESFAAPFALSIAVSRRRGRAAACNAALRLARGGVVIVLDDDMQVSTDFIERHLRHHGPDSRVCVLGAVPVELDPASPLVARYVQAKFAAHLGRLADPAHVYVPRDFYSGNASIRTEVLRAIGGFDESFTAYGNEDVDLGIRLRAAGVELRFDPEALACQRYEKDLGALARDTVAKGSTAVMLARAHPGVLPDLRLATPWDASRPWLSLRALLLSATRSLSWITRCVIAVATVLERAGAWRAPLFYRALLDFAFWAGVRSELRGPSEEGALAALVSELDRGPIDLLLHG